MPGLTRTRINLSRVFFVLYQRDPGSSNSFSCFLLHFLKIFTFVELSVNIESHKFYTLDSMHKSLDSICIYLLHQ